MTRTRGKMMASAAIIVSILALDTSEYHIRTIPSPLVLNSNFYMVGTFLGIVLYFTIVCLYVNHVTDWRRKIMVAMGFLSIIALVLSMHFILNTPSWDFEFRLILGIDKLSNSVFMSLIYIRDVNIRILLSAFVSLVVLLEIHKSDPYMQPINTIITSTCCMIVFATFFWLYMRVTSGSRHKIITATGFIFLFLVMILTYILSIWFSRWQILFDVLYCINVPFLFLYPIYTNMYGRLRDSQYYNFLDLTELPTRFTFRDLKNATENFQTPIGQGASGKVFKGTLQDGTIVAVKQMKGQPSREDEFHNEITIIGSLQHINLVHLLGYCITHRGERYLVYPFFENGSLDKWLFAIEEKRSRLTWKLRYRIAVDVGKALLYLHHDCRHHILHLDVKPANILLHTGFQALLSDFGISRSTSREESSVMTRARGTVGYVAPEMLVSTNISTKSDVFSYGMVLFELIGGRRNFETTVDSQTRRRTNSYFPQIAREKMVEGKLMEVVDRSLAIEEMNEAEVEILVSVAFQCIHDNPQLRPSMVDVVDMLEGHLPVYLPQESPTFVANFLDVESQYSASEEFFGSDVVETADQSETTLFSGDRFSVRTE